MADVKLEATIRGTFGTSTFATGAAVNADSTPTCVVLEQGTALAYAPTVTNKATGLYEVKIDCTAANGFEVGKEYTSYAEVVVGGVTMRGPVPGISAFTVRTGSVDAVTVGTSGIVAGSIAAGALTIAKFATDILGAMGVSLTGTATAGAATTITLPVGASSTDDFYVPSVIMIIGGTGVGQYRSPSAYVGSTRVATVTTWTTTPDNTSVIAVLAAGAIEVSSIWAEVLDANAPANAQTALQIMNIVIAAVTATMTDPDAAGAVTIRDTGNTKDRVTGTSLASGGRTLTTLDGS